MAKEPTAFVCPTCGQAFERKVPPSKSNRTQYCSRECADKGLILPDDGHICEVCGKHFYDRKHPDRKYCSHECNHKAQERRITLTCATCGKGFTVRTNRKHKIYCSRKCYREREITGPNLERRICEYCGKAFEVYPSRVHRFCSMECRGKSIQKPESFVTLVCKTCGKPYTLHKLYTERRNSSYCSRECMNAGLSIRKRGANNPNYRGGSVEYRGPNWRRVSRLVRVRDGYTCQICGKKPKSRRCHVHHIKPYREFNGDWQSANDLSNLITLCSNCHAKVEHGGLPCPQLLL